jgi:hypothetical protein
LIIRKPITINGAQPAVENKNAVIVATYPQSCLLSSPTVKIFISNPIRPKLVRIENTISALLRPGLFLVCHSKKSEMNSFGGTTGG